MRLVYDPRGAFFCPKKTPFEIKPRCDWCTTLAGRFFPQKRHLFVLNMPAVASQSPPELTQDIPELTQRPAGPPERPGAVPGGGFTDFLAESDGRVVKNEGLGILPRILRIQRKWWQQACPRPYLPHAPGVRMT